MYILRESVQALERKYGQPRVLVMEQEISPEEMEMVRHSQKDGRAHDVTFFITNNRDQIAVIRKPFHPPGVYRAPSGGINPGEDMEKGVLREAREETGLMVELQEYILRIKATFKCQEQRLDWTTHVFLASANSHRLQPLDTEEILEARWVTLGQLQGPIRTSLLKAGQGLLKYRVRLTDAVADILVQKGFS